LHSELTIASPDGVRHVATVFQPEAAQAPVFLCLPAMGAAAEYYRPFAAQLAERNLGVAALLDLRGQGRSSARARRGDDFGYREILELDLPRALDALRRAFRGRPLLLAGHSLGGQLGLLCAARPGVHLDGLVLIAAGTAHWRDWRGAERWKAWAATAAIGAAGRVLPWYPGHVLGFGGEQPRRLMRDWARVAREGRYAPEGGDLDYAAAARRLALPILSLGIRGDPVAPAGARESLLAMAPQAVVTRAELGGVREHRPWKRHFSWARAPYEVVEAIGAWLVGRAGKPAWAA
jgi:predicted alpha/beta hydrolase